jgi:Family of unknown function (DUF6339)
MSIPVTYPRLSSAVARPLFQEQKDLPIEELDRFIGTSYPKQEWHPTIPTRVTPSELSELRSTVLDIARAHGFPQPQPRGGHTLFDRQLATYLWDHMRLVPAEAAAGGVWSFLSLVLLPDVAAWRYPDRHPVRFIGRDVMIGTSNRHVFGRLWVRAYVFGPELLHRLIEDNFEGIFGRPAFGGSARVARAIGATMVRTMDEHQVTNSQELLRDAMKRLLRLASIVQFNALDDDQLSDLLIDAFTASANVI